MQHERCAYCARSALTKLLGTTPGGSEVKNLIAVVLCAAVLAACSSADEATRTLQGAGYKDIRITGYAFFGCDENDTFHTGFEATGPSGQRVSGVVCSGVMKGATIRTN